MTCEDFRLRLTAFSLGELEQGERQRTRDHLAACDDCASRVLVDRQLTALLRASAVPAPSETTAAVLAAVRVEAARDEAGLPATSPRRQAPPRQARRRHWVALAAALLAAAAVVAAALLVVPAPDPGSPLSAAWSSYHARGEDGLGTPSEAEAARLFAVLGPASRTPDLAAFGLAQGRLGGPRPGRARGRGGRVPRRRGRPGHADALAGRPAPDGQGTEGSELAAYRWGRHTSYWWRADGVVWCLVGTIDQERLYGIAEHLGGES